jgi:O-antigen ligase/polysaccharide polymerase Wzy-like membrane protein
VAVRTLREPSLTGRATAFGASLSSPGTLVLAAALPILFLHVRYQPGFTVDVGSTSVHVVLSDLAVLVVAAVAAWIWVRDRPSLGAGRWVWIATVAFLVWDFAAVVYPRWLDETYDSHTHLVTAGKFAEYALLAPAVAVLVRRRSDLELVLAVLIAWSVCASTVAVVQFFGWRILAGWPAGWRQPSFLGHHDLAGLSGAVGCVALLRLALPEGRPARWAVVAAVSGCVGLILSGSTAGAIGFGLAAAAAFVFGRWRGHVSRRRLAAIVCLPLVVLAGLVPLRSGDVGHLLRYFGIGPKEKQRNVETLVQRTLLIYIGWRIFLHHPVTGAGFESSLEQSVYSPYLADARAKFPSSPPRAFPSPAHPWGVQNLYVQSLAETGVIGFLLLVGLFVSGLATAGRVAWRGPPAVGLLAVLWLLVCVGVWNALGIIAGIPMDALTWLALGLAVAAAAARRAGVSDTA